MKPVKLQKIDSDVKDAITEFGNICVGRTSVALGKILGMRVYIEPPTVRTGDFDLLADIGADRSRVMVGILMSMEDNVKGAMLFIVEKEFIIDAVRIMTKKDIKDLSLMEDEENLSAVRELANIMAASYMKELDDYLGIPIFLAPMMVGVDMVGALVSFPLAYMEYSSKNVISIEAKFAVVDEHGSQTQDQGHIIVFPDEDSVIKLAKALGL